MSDIAVTAAFFVSGLLIGGVIALHRAESFKEAIAILMTVLLGCAASLVLICMAPYNTGEAVVTESQTEVVSEIETKKETAEEQEELGIEEEQTAQTETGIIQEKSEVSLLECLAVILIATVICTVSLYVVGMILIKYEEKVKHQPAKASGLVG